MTKSNLVQLLAAGIASRGVVPLDAEDVRWRCVSDLYRGSPRTWHEAIFEAVNVAHSRACEVTIQHDEGGVWRDYTSFAHVGFRPEHN